MDYTSFVTAKLSRQPPTGIAGLKAIKTPHLFPFQRDLVTWSLRRGRAALFADTGLGKSRMQLEWARRVAAHTRGDVLILAPLAVAAQTVREGELIGVLVNLCREAGDVKPGVNITNYERVHKFDPSRFAGVVLDESSIIKHHDAKTFDMLVEMFGQTAFKLCATATPSPNDYTELGTHAEFLGVCSRAEMLAEFFVHDGGETQVWRLKGHARKQFWRWVASWAALVRRPSDIGYSDDGYVLPPLSVEHHAVASDAETVKSQGLLFAMPAQTLSERRGARKASTDARVQACADAVNARSSEPWVVWCDLNAESAALTKSIPGAVEVKGSDSSDWKENVAAWFVGLYEEPCACKDDAPVCLCGKLTARRVKILVSKPSIFGWGLNFQHCSKMAFVGVTDSFEAYYQAVRRCLRFGQRKPVEVHIFASDAEGAVIANLKRKEEAANKMAEELSNETRDMVRAEVRGQERVTNDYTPRVEMLIPAWIGQER